MTEKKMSRIEQASFAKKEKELSIIHFLSICNFDKMGLHQILTNYKKIARTRRKFYNDQSDNIKRLLNINNEDVNILEHVFKNVIMYTESFIIYIELFKKEYISGNGPLLLVSFKDNVNETKIQEYKKDIIQTPLGNKAYLLSEVGMELFRIEVGSNGENIKFSYKQ